MAPISEELQSTSVEEGKLLRSNRKDGYQSFEDVNLTSQRPSTNQKSTSDDEAFFTPPKETKLLEKPSKESKGAKNKRKAAAKKAREAELSASKPKLSPKVEEKEEPVAEPVKA
jgi:hypothetical protein